MIILCLMVPSRAIIPNMNEFSKGDRVKHTPTGDMGVVSSQNEYWVFVKYDTLHTIMLTGDEQYNAQATRRRDLIKVQTDG